MSVSVKDIAIIAFMLPSNLIAQEQPSSLRDFMDAANTATRPDVRAGVRASDEEIQNLEQSDYGQLRDSNHGISLDYYNNPAPVKDVLDAFGLVKGVSRYANEGIEAFSQFFGDMFVGGISETVDALSGCPAGAIEIDDGCLSVEGDQFESTDNQQRPLRTEAAQCTPIEDDQMQRCIWSCLRGAGGGDASSPAYNQCVTDNCIRCAEDEPTTSSQAVQELSNAAQWLVDDTVSRACGGANGNFGSEGIFVRDLDGDDRDDLILSHEGIQCARPSRGRSDFCGAQVCLGTIYLRRGQLLDDIITFQGIVEGIGNESIPVISIFEHGGNRLRAQWNGSRFVSR